MTSSGFVAICLSSVNPMLLVATMPTQMILTPLDLMIFAWMMDPAESSDRPSVMTMIIFAAPGRGFARITFENANMNAPARSVEPPTCCRFRN